MREIPEPPDLEAVSKACDKVLAYMRTHYVEPETMDAIAKLCTFLSRVKEDIEWIEAMIKIMEENKKKGSNT